MIRITTQQEKSRTLVTIDGQLMASDVGEIDRFRNSVQGKVLLRLRGLSVCSELGLHLLQDWVRAGAQVDNASPFLRMVLEQEQSK